MGVCECEPLASLALAQGNMHQLRERLYDCFYLLPVRRKRRAVPEVMTPGTVTTIRVQLNPHRLSKGYMGCPMTSRSET